MKKVILKIDGMSCSACSNRVEKYLNKQPGVNASVNLVMAQAIINYDEDVVSLSDLDRFIEESGYKSLGVYNPKIEEKKDNRKVYLLIFGLLIVLLMFISISSMMHIDINLISMKTNPINYGICTFLLSIPLLIYGFDIIKSGIVKLLHKSPNMDSLVTIGVLSSFIYSLVNLILIILGSKDLVHHLYFESSAMIIYFIKLGRYIDKNSKEKTKEVLKDLVRITPESALIKLKNDEKEITIDEVKKGDILICKPGMKIAADGIITKGSAHFDESFITGESIPSKKNKDYEVIAGSINLDGYIEYKAVRIGKDSVISEIVRLVNEASVTKAPIARLADMISSIFVPGIMIIAFITFIVYLISGKSFDESIVTFVTVLVVACPCALGLATPLSMVVSNGKCAKDGILIKNNEILEIAKDIDTIIFDKTGTLTLGKLKVSKIYNYSDYTDKEILEIVSCLEKNSSHPISTAFKDYTSKEKVTNFENIEGIGIKGEINKKKYYAGNNKLFELLDIKYKYDSDEEKLSIEGNSILYLIQNKKVLALIGVKDLVKKEAKKTIKELFDMKKEIILLTGDNINTSRVVAKEVGIKNIIAGVMPKDKELVIKELIRDNHKVMMIGDGVNDAISLSLSTIGVSVYGSTDIASSSSDVILMKDDLNKIINLLNTSAKTIKIIKQNLFWAFMYNTVMISIAIGLFKFLGISISPMISSIFMVLSSLSVVFNSLRLRK